MDPIRTGLGLVAVLIVRGMALPPQEPNHFRSLQNSKQTALLHFNDTSDSLIVSKNTSNVIDITQRENSKSANNNTTQQPLPIDVPVTNSNDTTFRPLKFSTVTPTIPDRSFLDEANTESSTILSLVLPTAEHGTVTEVLAIDTHNTNTTLRSMNTITTAIMRNVSNIGNESNVIPTEASSRPIVSIRNTNSTAFVSPSKRSTTSLDAFTTSPVTIPPKEVRVSPGKIRPQIKLTTNYTSPSETGVRLPEGASAALAKPTKYHYYPHNQHIYLLPECAVQQVCNAVYVRLNFTQPLCACPGRYRDPCSASLDGEDLHTTELVTDPRTKALTLVKTCEPVAEMRECRTPKDWSLLALQNVRTGKSHYLVICRCPNANILEGPMSHDQPTYASVPGIRVYGMMCVQGNRRGRLLRHKRSPSDHLQSEMDENLDKYSVREKRNKQLTFPWHKVQRLVNTVVWD